MTCNPCIKTVIAKKVVKGMIRGANWGGSCFVTPTDDGRIELNIQNQSFSKSDLKYFIGSLSEIHKVLEG